MDTDSDLTGIVHDQNKDEMQINVALFESHKLKKGAHQKCLYFQVCLNGRLRNALPCVVMLHIHSYRQTGFTSTPARVVLSR